MKVELLEHPNKNDWMEVKRRALVTVGKYAENAPSEEWEMKILKARHSPIRRLRFSFYIECPYWVSVHLCRHHVGCQPYVRSQRNDRQNEYDRNEAPQNAMVSMILDLNAEALITLANKRLCNQASPETQEVVLMMCKEALMANPEFRNELVPMCAREGKCNEMKPCKKNLLIPLFKMED